MIVGMAENEQPEILRERPLAPPALCACLEENAYGKTVQWD